MARRTGEHKRCTMGDEVFDAFTPYPLPPKNPSLNMEGLGNLHAETLAELKALDAVAPMIPSPEVFLHSFGLKEAVVSSQIEGTQSTLQDMVKYEALDYSENPNDIEEIKNYIEAVDYARREMKNPKGLPICERLLCKAHEILMRGVRGRNKNPGVLRNTQNWIGGKNPKNAHFVPPPPKNVPDALGALDKWMHQEDELPPLIRVGLAHVQFETIHPFLDGNGRVGRLLIALLLEHWTLLSSPLLYVSMGFKKRRQEYYQRLNSVRTQGDWEGWCTFFLECVKDATKDTHETALELFDIINRHRSQILNAPQATTPAMRLFEILPKYPMITTKKAASLLKTTYPTAGKAIHVLCSVGVLKEVSGKKRNTLYAYEQYLSVLKRGTEIENESLT